MRDLAISMVIVCVLGCGARPAATAMGGDLQTGGACSVESVCVSGGGQGSLLIPIAVIAATVVGVAGTAYVYHLVRPGVRVTLSAPP